MGLASKHTSCRNLRGSAPEQRGHTLIELILIAPIFAIAALIVMQFHLAITDSIGTIYAQATIQQQLTFGMHSLLMDVRTATARVAAPCNTYLGASSASALCLQLPAIDTQGQSLASGTTDLVVYDLNAAAGALTRTVTQGAGSSRTNAQRTAARNITSFTFAQSANGARQDISCTLTANRVERGRPFTKTVTSRARLRNA